MNILYTESSPNIGGQELQAIAQMLALKAAGHTVVLACRKHSGIAREAENKGLRTVYIPFRNRLHLPSIRALLRLVCRFRPALLVCHSGHDSNTAGITRLLTPGRAGQFRIIRQKAYLAGKVKPFAMNHLCDAVVVPGQAVKHVLEQEGVHNPVRVVPPGFDFDAMREALRAPLPGHVRRWLDRTRGVPVILQVGMLRPEKGYDFMLDTLSHLRQQGRVFRWLIVGGGKPEEERALRAQIRHAEMDDIVLMAGCLSPALPVYRMASLLVMPSRQETFGMVAVEAAAALVPVMAARTGGLPDIIRDGVSGTLLPADDREAWLVALHDFFTLPDRYHRMACVARQDVESRFGIQHCVQRLLTAADKESTCREVAGA
ncbi:glycosyltransferase family 4 protein [Salmonella enterica subsp. enterica]|nr:glycosyltransferase family 1 protein [Salmonella enterica]ELJ2931546.1 glycosyltransferase family 4 protein [Salmonella enterica subsp. enterica]